MDMWSFKLNYKMKISIYIISLFMISCGSNEHQQDKSIVVKFSNTAETSQLMKKDTIIVYDIEGISSEGAAAKTKYEKGKIQESTINIYGETGQARINYIFSSNQIDVKEQVFSYKTELENVNSKEDMILEKELFYSMDLNGVPLGKVDKDRIDIFQEFKEVVPFKLK
jgi:hypothetical protein